MKLRTFLINLEGATERRQRMDQQLTRLQMPYTLISATHGALLDEPIEGFDPIGFKLRTGKLLNKHEVGCYFSHLRALRAFLKTPSEHALILEDDAMLPDHLPDLIDAAIHSRMPWDLLRLSSTREGKYIELLPLNDGHRLVIDTRVLKNTAAYVINRHAAERCLRRLDPMRWPFDVALDRDWHIGIRTACIHPFPVTLTNANSQIPRSPRIRLLRGTTFHLIHLSDHIRRILYRHRVAKACKSAAQP